MERHPENTVDECRYPGLACTRPCLECRGLLEDDDSVSVVDRLMQLDQANGTVEP